jgi:basic membrane protein A
MTVRVRAAVGVTTMALLLALMAGCAAGVPSPTPSAETQLKVGVMLDSGSENDKNFNEYTLKGARAAAEELGIAFHHILPQSADDYDGALEGLITDEEPDLVITVGFRMGDATAKSARRHPELRFAIVDNAYAPGFGCAETVTDCYTEGGLTNVTSLMSAEDEPAYLAGVLAGCMTETGIVATVAGQEIPPVVRLLTGFENGARSSRPDVTTLHQYIPDFNDPDTGQVVGQGFISDGADVIFAAAGNTGNGGLLAAKQGGVMAIGVDVDQYLSYPDVADALLTSAVKNVDVAAHRAVNDYVNGKLAPGIRLGTLNNGGVGLAPYHDWDDRIPQECKDQVTAAEAEVKADPTITGAK